MTRLRRCTRRDAQKGRSKALHKTARIAAKKADKQGVTGTGVGLEHRAGRGRGARDTRDEPGPKAAKAKQVSVPPVYWACLHERTILARSRGPYRNILCFPSRCQLQTRRLCQRWQPPGLLTPSSFHDSLLRHFSAFWSIQYAILLSPTFAGVYQAGTFKPLQGLQRAVLRRGPKNAGRGRRRPDRST